MRMGSTKLSIVIPMLFALAGTLASAEAGAVRSGGASINPAAEQGSAERLVSGVVVNERSEVVVGATVSAQWAKGGRTATTGGQGAFSIRTPAGPVTLTVTGRYISSFRQVLAADAPSETLRLQVHYEIPRRRRPWSSRRLQPILRSTAATTPFTRTLCFCATTNSWKRSTAASTPGSTRAEASRLSFAASDSTWTTAG